MSHLLDVNVLLAAIWGKHQHHALVFQWLEGKSLCVCPIVELGFLRISTDSRVFAVGMDEARTALEDFFKTWNVQFVADDLRALETRAKNSGAVGDQYLAGLAQKHQMKFATLDRGIQHPAVSLIENPPKPTDEKSF